MTSGGSNTYAIKEEKEITLGVCLLCCVPFVPFAMAVPVVEYVGL